MTAILEKLALYWQYPFVRYALDVGVQISLCSSLLISALIIFPALSAMRVFKSFRSVTICSAILSIFCSLLGILISILAGTPVGSTIVAVDIVLFFVFSAFGTILGGVRA